jgi:hypothetical protein
LIVQAVGGGMAASAVSTPNEDTTPGTDIMVAGIIFQMAAVTVFMFFAINFLLRIKRKNLGYLLTREVKRLLLGTAVSVLFIYIRSIYRTIELLQGWDGYLITHEVYFIALDGATMVVAVAIFNVFHPAWLLPLETPSKKTPSVESTVAQADCEMW